MMTAQDPIDTHIGHRLRVRRLWMGFSLVELGDHVGLTHQQIQNYEYGRCRISASRLYDIAQALEVSFEYFFKQLSSSDTPPNSGMDQLECSGFLQEVLNRPDVLELNRAFIKIKDIKLRRWIINLIRMLGA